MSSYFKKDEQSNSNNINSDSLSNASFKKKIKIYYNSIRDKIIVYKGFRWSFIVFLLIIYFIRILYVQGYYALTYCIGIHFLNSFIGFISPLDDPEDEDLDEEISHLPQSNNEEFRPFQRKLKEYEFWRIMFWTLIISFPMTFFEAFNIPVFWPLLLVYFIMIFFLIMRKQIKHMIKYHYLPWDSGKKTYTRVPSQI